MEVVLISDEAFFEREAEIVVTMFENGLSRFHLRKPGASAEAMSTFLDQLPEKVCDQIAVHGHEELVEPFKLSHNHAPHGRSRSCHSLEELDELGPEVEYVFLSPIFNSISKQDYPAAFDYEKLKEALNIERSSQVLALGGISLDKLATCKELGFDGVALLGSVWRKPDPVEALNSFLQWQA